MGRVASTLQDHGRLTILLESGQRIGEGQVRAATERHPDGTASRAYLTRYEPRTMSLTPTVPPPTSSAPPTDYQHWKELATATEGITQEEPRFQQVLAMLQRCETVFLSGDRAAFLRAKQQTLKYIAASTPRIKSDRPVSAGPIAKSA